MSQVGKIGQMGQEGMLILLRYSLTKVILRWVGGVWLFFLASLEVGQSQYKMK